MRGKKDDARERERDLRLTGLKRPMTGRGRTPFDEETVLSKSLRLRSVVVPLDSAEARRLEASVRHEESDEFGKKTESREVQQSSSFKRKRNSQHRPPPRARSTTCPMGPSPTL